MKVWREANQKPPLGAVVNWESPANAGLIFHPVFNEGAGSPGDLVTGTLAMPDGGSWRTNEYEFNGTTDRLDWANVGDLSATAHSYAAWLYLDAVAHHNRWMVLHISNDTAPAEFADVSTSRSLRLFAYNTLGTYGDTHSADADVPLTEWVHVVITVPDNVFPTMAGCGMYVNGVSKGHTQNASSGTVAAQAGQWSVGGNYYDDTRSVDGRIADVRVWNRVLTADEIRADYTEPYGRERYLVPGFARIFDMGAGGVPIGAIRTRFPALTGGLRI